MEVEHDLAVRACERDDRDDEKSEGRQIEDSEIGVTLESLLR